MTQALQHAMRDEPWSVAGVVRGLDMVLDDEGRPLSERRAPSTVKVGVPIVLKACPYRDERHGAAMNVSALAQITRHLGPVLADIAGMVRAQPEPITWRSTFSVVLDQLSAPAIFLLRTRDAGARVPAALAVGHKLAAGYFGVVRALVSREACGIPTEVSARALRDYVHAERALLGASEVCAGSPNLLDRCSRVLLGEEQASEAPAPTPDRMALTALLAQQALIGLAWDLFDRAECRQLLLSSVGRTHMRPRNHYMAARLDDQVRALDVATGTPDGELSCLPQLVDPGLARLMQGPMPDGLDPDVIRLVGLYAFGDQAIELDHGGHRELVARRCARYVRVYREVLSRQWHAEVDMRRGLGFAPAVGVRFDPTVLAKGRALALFEAMLGHRLDCEPGPRPDLAMKNHKRTIHLSGAEAVVPEGASQGS